MCEIIDRFVPSCRKQALVKVLPPLVAVFLAVFGSACGTRSDLLLRGAATGAVVGGLLKGTGRDMARGAAIGAVGGYILGEDGECSRRHDFSCASGRADFALPEVCGDKERGGRGKSVTWGQL